MKSMIVQVNGIRLGVEQRGEARKSAPTLVMLHGFTGSAASSPLTCLAMDNPMLPKTRGAIVLSIAGKISWQRSSSLA